MIVQSALIKKEIMELFRTGKAIILGLISIMIGVMNPAIAKFTPEIYKLMSDSLNEAGIQAINVKVTALTSWTQFYKNIPIMLIAFVLIMGGIFARENERGTMTMLIARGVDKGKIINAKAFTLVILWTMIFWISFAITYTYNEYYWDNSIANEIAMAGICYWIFGIFVASSMVIFSIISNNSTGVYLLTGALVGVCVILGIVEKIAKILPTRLIDGMSLINGITKIDDYKMAIVITIIIIVLEITFSHVLKKLTK